MGPTPRLRLATIGAWGHVSLVLKELTGCAGVEVVGLAKALPQDDAEDRPASLRRFPVAADAPAFDDYRRMLREARPDVVIVSTRLDRIAPIAIDAARAGCHLLCEKPLATTHADLAALRQAVARGGVRCAAMLPGRSHPAMLATRQRIAAGEIGEVLLANARKSYQWGSRPAWFGERQTYGGTIPWIGIHALDFIHSTTGLTFTRVAAMHANRAHPDRPGCEDIAVLILGLSNGGHATASLDYLRPARATSHGDDWLRVVGTHGVIEAHVAESRCRMVTHDRGPCEVPLPASPGFFRPLLADLLAGGDASAAEQAKAFLLTHVALCARDAADQGIVLPVSPPDW